MTTKPHRPRGIYLLPNLFTIGAIFAGFFAIISSFKGNYDNAAISIFIAMIMDTLDGKVARLTNTMTAFGAEFDSMADMVSFAVAPAFLAYTWGLSDLGKFGWISAFIYTVAVALRLARFNTQLDSSGKRYFQGLPCPSAAAIVSSLVWICYDLGFTNKITMIILALTMIIVGILMVSNIRYRSFKDAELKNNVRFVVILAVVLAVALVSIDPEKVLFFIFTSYALSGPIATVWGLQQKKRLRKITLLKPKKT
ncbi:MAG TPA: CDP-diacylglycerol--serine O-phosphatidyltransferase [Coxiellaceae bacterium]|nr:CDP-diacylglycerol--serine O-phosphatidyltransferase [Coxiellaceae bacterium]HBS51933.1 CDP-diacylglycerol--serine O-phosphatidyltransferase [Coxiellaceae bacterium]HBY55817.1 CDP-diacylglycerol--serine O-phosphatidyltransferase [Coxiellaceae bacterium]